MENIFPHLRLMYPRRLSLSTRGLNQNDKLREMTPELRQSILERYLGWTESWALTLAFAITQSHEKSDRLLADAMVALIATEAMVPLRELTASSHAVRFASVLWETAQTEAYRGFGSESFF